MTKFPPQTNPDGLVKLAGAIRNLRVTRSCASFVFTPQGQSKLGLIAIASALAGLDGQAATSSHNANDLEEAADYLEFDLNDQPIKGWVWRNPFREGDLVQVAAETVNGHFEAFGIARASDHMVSLYPHCSRGRIAHFMNALKWWLLGSTGFILFVSLPFFAVIGGVDELLAAGTWAVCGGLMTFFGVMTFFLTRQWLPFVRVAEKVFRVLELPNPSSIDLVKSSKAQRRPDDPGEYGTFYFRY